MSEVVFGAWLGLVMYDLGELQQLDIFCRQLVVCDRKNAYDDIEL